MRVQVDMMQNASHRACRNLRHDAINHGLASQVLTAPMCEMQSLSDWLQARKLHDLCVGHRGKYRQDGRFEGLVSKNLPDLRLRNGDKFSEPLKGRIASVMQQTAPIDHQLSPTACALVVPETRIRCGYARHNASNTALVTQYASVESMLFTICHLILK